MFARGAIATRAVVVGALAFVCSALVVGTVAALILGFRSPGAGVNGTATFVVDIVQTPQGMRFSVDPRADIRGRAILATVRCSMATRDRPWPNPVYRDWKLTITSVEPGPDCPIPASDTGFWRAAVAEGMHASNRGSPFTPATIAKAHNTDTFSETSWRNALIHGAAALTHLPWCLAALFALCMTVAIVGSIRATREYRRALRGFCRRCGYSLSGISALVCPECGHPADLATQQPSNAG